METYYIDRKGGRHYHHKDCPHVVNNPQYNYESVTRSKRRLDREYILTRIRDKGKYYIPCPSCMFEHRRKQ